MPEPHRPSRIEGHRGRFDQVAERTSDLVGRAGFFMVAVALVLLWVPMAFVMESIDTWQLVLSTATSVAAFLLLALLQNSERRTDRALHRKVDVMAVALAALLRERGIQQPGQAATAEELQAAVRLEERL
jgi:low affinity Fe/Cu permease